MGTDDEMNREEPFSLNGTLEAVSLHIEVEDELREKQLSLDALQVVLLDLNNSCKTVEFELRNTDRQLSGVLVEIDQIKWRNIGLESQLHEIYSENVKLQLQIQEQEERQQASLTRYTAYRNKMENHKMAIKVAQRQTLVSKELAEAREQAQNAGRKQNNPSMNIRNEEEDVVTQLLEIDDLEQQVLASARDASEDKLVPGQRGREALAEPRKDIELLIKKRRYEAMVRRMRRQGSQLPYQKHQTH